MRGLANPFEQYNVTAVDDFGTTKIRTKQDLFDKYRQKNQMFLSLDNQMTSTFTNKFKVTDQYTQADLARDDDSPYTRDQKKKKRKEARQKIREQMRSYKKNPTKDPFHQMCGDETLNSKKPSRFNVMHDSDEQGNKSGTDSSELNCSDFDNKEDPNFFKKGNNFNNLPDAVKIAVENSKQKAKHSDFYYKLSDLNNRIGLYKKLFYNKIPQYQVDYKLKKQAEKLKVIQTKQAQAKGLFVREVVENK